MLSAPEALPSSNDLVIDGIVVARARIEGKTLQIRWQKGMPATRKMEFVVIKASEQRDTTKAQVIPVADIASGTINIDHALAATNEIIGIFVRYTDDNGRTWKNNLRVEVPRVPVVPPSTPTPPAIEVLPGATDFSIDGNIVARAKFDDTNVQVRWQPNGPANRKLRFFVKKNGAPNPDFATGGIDPSNLASGKMVITLPPLYQTGRTVMLTYLSEDNGTHWQKSGNWELIVNR